jgi:hypothetical protein
MAIEYTRRDFLKTLGKGAYKGGLAAAGIAYLSGCKAKTFIGAKSIPAEVFLTVDNVFTRAAGDTLCGNFDQDSSIALIQASADLNYDGNTAKKEKFVIEVTPSLRKAISQKEFEEMCRRYANAKVVKITGDYEQGRKNSGAPEEWANEPVPDPGIPRIISGKIRLSTDYIRAFSDIDLETVKERAKVQEDYQGKGPWDPKTQKKKEAPAAPQKK